MKTHEKKCLVVVFMLITTFSTKVAQAQLQSVPSEPYVWKNAQIVGGGFVDGIVFHTNAKDVRYCRTDMGGAYRWDQALQRWISMLDWISYDDNNLVGVESIAVDPNDPLTVYLSCGTYTRSPNGAVLISNDGGKSFTRVDMPFKMGGNENGRGNGERMMVDPANSNIIYLGTRQAGLWRSMNKGKSWHKVSSFPDIEELPDPSTSNSPALGRPQGCGIVFVVFDPTTAVQGKGCNNIYVGVSLMGRDNLFVSNDGGERWKAVDGQPVRYRPTQGALSSDGNLYITYGTNPGPQRMTDGAVWKYTVRTGNWKDVSPVKADPENGLTFGYASVSVDLKNPQHLIVSSFNLRVPERYTEDDIFRSTDGGTTWKPVFAGITRMDYSKAPYTEFTPLHWMFDVEINPFDPNHAIFTTGYGGWETFNLNDTGTEKPTVWHIMSTGIDETVPLELYSPVQGAHLISGVGDYGGFTHFDLDKPSPTGSHTKPYFGNTNGLAGAVNSPELVVRVGTVHGHHREGKPFAYSKDGGISWTEPDSIPQSQARNGHIAVSSDGATWIWTPDRMPVYYTKDKGSTWQLSAGIPENIRVVADQVNPNRFYALDIAAGLLYRSDNGGISFTADSLLAPFSQARAGGTPQPAVNRGDRRGGQDRVYAAPKREGDLWIAAYDGLYHIEPGKEMVQLDKVRLMLAFGFGKEKPGHSYPALYMIGIVNGIYGFFRSDDAAESWVRINDDEHQYGLVLHITGDPKQYGRVYVGTHGRGVVYGDPR